MPPPRPHPLARSPRVDRVNGWLETAWRKGWSSRPSLDPADLWAKALRSAPAAGEFGGRCAEDAADFRLRLEQLCASLQAEAQLNPLGLTMAHGQLVRAVRLRLQLGALWQVRPDLLETPLAPPIIVIGQMRSGTTRLHRLLAADPAHAATRFCDSWLPLPRRPDTRPLWSGMSLIAARLLDPWLDSIHPFGVTRPDEELGWLAGALNHCAYEAQWRVPSFTAFSEARDPAPVYREFARVLATDAAWHGNASRPRVLKVPQFSEDLSALLAQFPDARIVRTQRDANDTLASAVSLVANQMTIQSDLVDCMWIEEECTRKMALREARMNAMLADFAGPLAEVDFAALDADWEGEMARVYTALGMDFTAAAAFAMQAEMGRAPQSGHHGHRASNRDFVRP